jgi:predicted permease
MAFPSSIINNVVFSSLSDNLIAALSSNLLWTAIAKTLIIILVGFFLVRWHFLPEGSGKLLSKVVLAVALPCLAFTSFMSDYSLDQGRDALINFILSFVLYLLFIGLSRVIFFWIKDPRRREILGVLFAFGSTTFFAQPILLSVYGSNAFNDSNLQNVAFRVFLYSYAYLVISKGVENQENITLKGALKKIALNPILIATLLGLTLWALQGLPGASEAQWWTLRKDWLQPTENSTITYVPFWRFDVSLPWINSVLSLLGSLASPLVWLSIGCTLGMTPFKEAFKDKLAWLYSFLRCFVAPAIALAFVVLLEAIASACGYPVLISSTTMVVTVLMWMVPTSTVATSYCIALDQEKTLASNCAFISTLVAIPGIVFWVLITSLLSASGFFYAL